MSNSIIKLSPVTSAAGFSILDNRTGNILYVSWCGIQLGRIMVMRRAQKNERPKFTIVDWDQLEVSSRPAQFTDLDKAVIFMRKYRRTRTVKQLETVEA